MSKEKREVFEGRTELLPEVPMAGFDVFRSAGDLPAHVHEEDFEICLIVAGSVDWWAGDRLYEVHGGDLFVTRPGERHGGQHAVMNPCTLYWFHVRVSGRRTLPGMGRKESEWVRRGLSKLSLRSFKASGETVGACERLQEAHRVRDRWSVMAGRGALHEVLAGVMRDHEAARRARLERSARVVEAMAYMSERVGEPYRVEDVAEAVGVNVGNLHAQFLREVGLTVGDWRTRLLMRRGKEMLGDRKRSVTEIAMALGYSSSQYFATAFRRVVGMTPGEYRGRLNTDQS